MYDHSILAVSNKCSVFRPYFSFLKILFIALQWLRLITEVCMVSMSLPLFFFFWRGFTLLGEDNKFACWTCIPLVNWQWRMLWEYNWMKEKVGGGWICEGKSGRFVLFVLFFGFLYLHTPPLNYWIFFIVKIA